MKSFRSLLLTGRLLVFTLTGWLLTASLLLAEEEKKPSGGGKASWVLAGFLVLLGVIAGMVPVCLASRRRDRVKPETYTEGKKYGEESSGK